MILIKVADFVHFFTDFDLEVAVKGAVLKSGLGTDGDDAHATIGGADFLGELGPLVGGDAIDLIGSTVEGGGGGEAVHALNEDISGEGTGDFNREVAHVETTGNELIPFDVGLNLNRMAVHGELIVVHRLADAIADAFRDFLDGEEIVALDLEVSGVTEANLTDFADEAGEDVVVDFRDDGVHDLSEDDFEIGLDNGVVADHGFAEELTGGFALLIFRKVNDAGEELGVGDGVFGHGVAKDDVLGIVLGIFGLVIGLTGQSEGAFDYVDGFCINGGGVVRELFDHIVNTSVKLEFDNLNHVDMALVAHTSGELAFDLDADHVALVSSFVSGSDLAVDEFASLDAKSIADGGSDLEVGFAEPIFVMHGRTTDAGSDFGGNAKSVELIAPTDDVATDFAFLNSGVIDKGKVFVFSGGSLGVVDVVFPTGCGISGVSAKSDQVDERAVRSFDGVGILIEDDGVREKGADILAGHFSGVD